MHEFKNLDKVFCPALSNNPFIVFQKEGVNGIFLVHRGKEYWFTLSGVPPKNFNFNNSSAKSLSALHKADLITSMGLEALHGEPFPLSGYVKLFALLDKANTNEDYNYWLAKKGDRYYLDMVGTGDILNPSQMKDRNIVIGVSPEHLEGVMKRVFQEVVCIGWDDIDNWCN